MSDLFGWFQSYLNLAKDHCGHRAGMVIAFALILVLGPIPCRDNTKSCPYCSATLKPAADASKNQGNSPALLPNTVITSQAGWLTDEDSPGSTVDEQTLARIVELHGILTGWLPLTTRLGTLTFPANYVAWVTNMNEALTSRLPVPTPFICPGNQCLASAAAATSSADIAHSLSVAMPISLGDVPGDPAPINTPIGALSALRDGIRAMNQAEANGFSGGWFFSAEWRSGSIRCGGQCCGGRSRFRTSARFLWAR